MNDEELKKKYFYRISITSLYSLFDKVDELKKGNEKLKKANHNHKKENEQHKKEIDGLKKENE